MDAQFVTVPCIVVDWDTYTRDDSFISSFLESKSEFYDIVVFVSDTVHNDFNDRLVAWDATAVIRNSVTNPMSARKFKLTAFATLQDGSNLSPVLAFDVDPSVQKDFEDAGVLLAFGEWWD